MKRTARKPSTGSAVRAKRDPPAWPCCANRRSERQPGIHQDIPAAGKSGARLDSSAADNRVSVIRELRCRGMPANTELTAYRRTSLCRAAWDAEGTETAAAREHSAGVNSADLINAAPPQIAAKRNFPEIAELSTDAGADPTTRSGKGFTLYGSGLRSGGRALRIHRSEAKSQPNRSPPDRYLIQPRRTRPSVSGGIGAKGKG